MALSKTEVLQRCEHFLAGHGPQAIQKSLLAMANYVDPHLKKDVYGQGELLSIFESKCAKLLGYDAAVFMPSGTMAQQIALRL